MREYWEKIETLFFNEYCDKLKIKHKSLIAFNHLVELFFFNYYNKKFPNNVQYPELKNNIGYDIIVLDTEYEVKHSVSNTKNFQLRSLHTKINSHLCMLLDSVDYCYIGYGIPPHIWVKYITNDGRMNICIDNIQLDMFPYIKHYNKATLKTLFKGL